MYISDINCFLNNVNDLISKKNITKSQFYKEIGISAGSFGDWKSGKSKPSEKTLTKLANYFNCSIDDLIKQSSDNDDITSQRILNVFNSLDDKYKNKAIAEIIELLNIDSLVKVLDDTSKNNILNILIELSIKCSDEQIKKANENKAYIAALGGGVTEIDKDLAKYIKENAVPLKPTPPKLK